MLRAIYPGSFDPITNGHLDVLYRASRLFDEVIFAVANNQSKQVLFSVSERVKLMGLSCQHIPNVRVASFNGLLVDFARKSEAKAVVRGLRAVSDFEFEFQTALMNRSLEPGLEALFLMPSEEYSYISSRMVKEVARLGGEVSRFVPKCVEAALKIRFAAEKEQSGSETV